MKKLFILIFCMASLGLLMSFKFKNSKKDKERIYLEKPSKKKKTQFANFVYIPSGTLMLNEDEKHDVQGFFMSQNEISNLEYQEFLFDLEKNEEKEKLEIAQIHNDNWIKGNNNNEPFKEVYSSHPAYHHYPVVNITRDAAYLYCQWLTEKWQEKSGIQDIEFRLPGEFEWMYAARGGHDLSPFPWGGYYTRNAKGCVLANFKVVDQTDIKFDRKSGEYEIQKSKIPHASITSPVTSYHPNDYGLYNMSGNVTEMLGDVGTKGGSWGSTGYYLQIDAEDEFPELRGESSIYVGFRPVAIIKGNIEETVKKLKK